MKNIALVGAGFGLLLAAAARAADPGVTGAPVVQIPLGARALGMGGAFSAVATDASALQYNPAGLARLMAHEIDLSYVPDYGVTTLQTIAYAGPTPFSGISGNGYTSVASSLVLSESGKIEVNTLRPDGSLESSRSLNAGSDMVFTAGYAERVGMTPLDLPGASYGIDHFLGISGKYIRSTLAQTYHATTYAADVGYLVSAPDTGWSAGASVLNLGGKLRYLDLADPLPLSARGGIAWQGGVPAVHSLIASMDGDYMFDERLWHLNAGVEYFWMKMYGLRFGYQFHRQDQGGLTVGFGFRWKGRVMIDYAYDLGDLLGSGHRVSLTYRFGAVSASVRGRKRRPYVESSPDRNELPDIQQQRPVDEDPPRPRAVPRERLGAPGWIY